MDVYMITHESAVHECTRKEILCVHVYVRECYAYMNT